MKVRSVSFDTSFLLNYDQRVDKVINLILHDRIPCYITSTVVSELEQLKIWGRITNKEYYKAINRWKHSHATIIDFKNRLLSNSFGKFCIDSMKKHHGIEEKDIKNDCNILVSTLKNGVDIFLSLDFHFTSKITREVIDELKNAACSEYHLMCDSILYSIDTITFLNAYNNGDIDLDIITSSMKSIKKNGKRI